MHIQTVLELETKSEPHSGTLGDREWTQYLPLSSSATYHSTTSQALPHSFQSIFRSRQLFVVFLRAFRSAPKEHRLQTMGKTCNLLHKLNSAYTLCSRSACLINLGALLQLKSTFHPLWHLVNSDPQKPSSCRLLDLRNSASFLSYPEGILPCCQGPCFLRAVLLKGEAWSHTVTQEGSFTKGAVEHRGECQALQ